MKGRLNVMKCFYWVAMLAACGSLGIPAVARAQESPPPETPAPVASPTLVDNEFDGQTHITAAPYIWAPSVGADFQYTIPRLAGRLGGAGQTVSGSAQVGPSDYLPKLNSAVMFSLDVRKGDIDFFGDYMYVNASVNAAASATLTGPLGKLSVPVSLSTTAHLRQSIWEAAAGVTVAHGHNGNLDFFAGLREYPISVTFGYNAVVGRKNQFVRSGSVQTGDIAQDIVTGFRGKVFFGDSHLFVPYYADIGTGIGALTNQTWQAYGGAGYAFNHGQSMTLLYRDLTYTSFTPISHVQKLAMYGPLLGYTFYL